MNRKYLRVGFFAMVFTLVSTLSMFSADISGTWQVDYVGVHNNYAYFSLKNYTFLNEDQTQPVMYGVVYIDLSTPGGRALYTQVLTAQTTGQKVKRVAYSEKDNGLSIASLIQIAAE